MATTPSSSSSLQPRSPLDRLFGLFFFWAGIAAICWGVRDIIHAHESVRWPTVEGRVGHSEVVNGNRSTYASVTYYYQVSGAAYYNDCVRFGGAPGGALMAGIVVGRYPVGLSVRVHYNPASPDESVLEPGVRFFNELTLPIVGLVLFLFGCRRLAESQRQARLARTEVCPPSAAP
jgi:hypothetical protein